MSELTRILQCRPFPARPFQSKGKWEVRVYHHKIIRTQFPTRPGGCCTSFFLFQPACKCISLCPVAVVVAPLCCHPLAQIIVGGGFVSTARSHQAAGRGRVLHLLLTFRLGSGLCRGRAVGKGEIVFWFRKHCKIWNELLFCISTNIPAGCFEQ